MKTFFWIVSLMILGSCSNPLGKTEAVVDVGSNSGATISISPTSVTLFANESQTFTATGTAPHYFFSTTSGGTSRINQFTGVYSNAVTNTETSDEVRVFDADGKSASAAVTILRPTSYNLPNSSSAIAKTADGRLFFSGVGSDSNPTPIYRSTDRGATWSLIHTFTTFTTSTSGQLSTPIFESAAGSLFAYGRDWATNRAAIYRSTDGGSNWTKVTEVNPASDRNFVQSLIEHPTLGLIAFVNLETGFQTDFYAPSGYIKSTDGGATWTALTTATINGSEPAYFDGKIFAIESGVISSTDGQNYVAETLPTNPTSGTYLKVLSDGALWFSGNNGLYRLASSGGAWSKVSNSTANTEYVMNAAGNLIARAGVELRRSTDNGQTWSTISAPSGGDTVAYLILDELGFVYHTVSTPNRVIKMKVNK